jgi:hypothetical protein
MIPSTGLPPPHARDDAPWSDCGDPRDSDFGTVYSWPAAGAAVALTYDRPGRRHAATLFDRRRLRAEIVLNGRRFSVAPAPGGWDR